MKGVVSASEVSALRRRVAHARTGEVGKRAIREGKGGVARGVHKTQEKGRVSSLRLVPSSNATAAVSTTRVKKGHRIGCARIHLFDGFPFSQFIWRGSFRS